MPDPNSVLDTFLESLKRQDLSKALSCFTPDAAILGSAKGEEVRGVTDLEHFFLRIFAKTGTYRFEFQERDWTVHQDVAWLVSNGTVIEPEQEHSKPYRLVAIFQRSESEWRMALWSGTEPV